jgi:DNA-binding winged helix-turn-helix (wHTH) protein/tetratricopeptide (TPR) repeat protein
MSYFFRSEEFEIYPQTGELRIGNESLKIRPKTCQLLTFLIEASGQIVSKDTLLQAVWDDVSVDEQVVFQSVKELRKLFQGNDVIKTHPRKGYAWIAPVEKVPIGISSTNAPTQTHSVVHRWYGKLGAALALILTIALVIVFQRDSATPIHRGSILVLPVKTTLTDADHRWVRYGAMDQLLQSLRSSESFTVMQTDDVLDILKRAQVPYTDYSQEDINRIFQVSGASMIVGMTLTGSTRDYQLIYSLYENGQTDRGALLSDTSSDLLRQLGSIVAQRVGQEKPLRPISYHSSFANEMLASALESLQSEDYDSASKLLAAATATEPENVTAKRLRVQSLVSSQQFADAENQIRQTIMQAKAQGDQRELARTLFWAGLNQLQQRQITQGIQLLSQAQIEANAVKDWLYLGYISEAMGKAYHAIDDFKLARIHFESSLDYHQMIQCPNGYANGLLNLGALSLDEGDLDAAKNQFQQALSISEDRSLSQVNESARIWMDKINLASN